MSTRLCAVCNSIFSGAQILRQDQTHHQSEEDFQLAAEKGCYICSSIIFRSETWHAIDRSAPFKAVWHLAPVERMPPDWLKLTIDMMGDEEDEEGDDDEPSLTEDEVEIEQQKKDDDIAREYEDEDYVIPKSPVWGFFLYAAADDDNKVVRGWTPPADCQDESFFDISIQWLSDCVSKHTSCSPSKPDFRPTRLLQIVSDETLRVIIPQEEATCGPYAAFSHCWGKAVHLKLLRSNLDQLRQEIKVSGLPRSYQEAVRVCRQLDIHYIWIDSLCILQDSADDWEREAITMGDVYGQSILTIAAAAAAESSAPSFASRDASLIEPLMIQTSWAGIESTKCCLFDGDIYADDLRDSPLASHAWVVQELWLSPRTLYLTSSQLWWECRDFRACEAFPSGVPNAYLQNGAKPTADYSDSDLVHDAWNEIFERYTRCRLTVLSDRMIACAGIAQSFQTLLPDDTYVAGLWRSQLPQALFWETSSHRAGRRPPAYRAPSWSWASIEMGVDTLATSMDFMGIDSVETCCSLLDVATNPSGPDAKGSLAGGFIKIQGQLTEVCSFAGNYGTRITVQQAGGSWGYIEGSDESCGRFLQRQSWTSFTWDECTPTGDPVISYLENFPPQAPYGLSMTAATRTIIYTNIRHWTGTTWTLPIVQWRREGKPFCGGIVLCQMPAWPGDLFQRVGSFTAAGDPTIDELKRRSKDLPLTII